MKRVLVLGILLTAIGFAAAMASVEIRCSFLGPGSGGSASPNYDVRYFLGPAVVGVSGSANHEIIHGPVPCEMDAITGVGDPIDPDVPIVLRLHQNAPNPFNPHTEIHYDLPRESRVRLRIFDLAGRLIRVLVDQTEPAGNRSAIWNGRDDGGRTVASGTYIYQLETNERSFTRKMMLLK